MSNEQKIFVPSEPLPPGRTGVLTPFESGVETLPAGFQIAPEFLPLPVDVVFEKDVAVTLRDGVTVHVDVFRPVGDEPVPVIVAWSPYGKGQGTSASVKGVFAMVGLNDGIVSGLEKFEGPDPAYWCAHGYAICNPDIRGVVDSRGRQCAVGPPGRSRLLRRDRVAGRTVMVQRQSRDERNLLPSGVAVVHRRRAAAAPGGDQPVGGRQRRLSRPGDAGRHAGYRFRPQLQDGSFFGKNRKEDILAEAERYPLMNDLWENKIPAFEQITVPAYVVASYTNTLHTAGTFRAWRRIASQDKWLRIHNSQEWPDYYDEANRDDLRRFFDRYLKDVDNGWESTPRVRYSVLDLEGGDRVGIFADEFPPAEVISTKYYLDGRARVLSAEAPTDGVEAAYDVDSNPNAVSFIKTFDRETVMVGYPKAHLWVEARGAQDLDLFVLVQKLDAYGTPLAQFTVPNHNARIHDLTDHGATVLRYKGSDGRLRVSARHLDVALSTDDVPAHTFDRVEKLSAGEIVDVEIDLLPIGLVFHPGEQLRFVISSRNLLGTLMPAIREYVGANRGQHVIHTGGQHAFLPAAAHPEAVIRRPVLAACPEDVFEHHRQHLAVEFRNWILAAAAETSR